MECFPQGRRVIAVAACIAACMFAITSARAEDTSEFDRSMNLGIAHLENRESAKAIDALSAAIKLNPTSARARRNLARAQSLARKHEDALQSLDKANPLDPDSPATAYLTGLAYAHLSRFEEAIPYLEAAVRLDPHTATLRFQLATAYQAARLDEKTIEQLRETVRLDPMHASAHYKLATYARKAGDKEEFQARQREFMRLRKLFGDATRTATALETCVYTRPETARVTPARRDAGRPKPIDVRFIDATHQVFKEVSTTAVAAVLDLDESGHYILFVADADGALALLAMSSNGVFERTPIATKLPEGFGPTACLVGDFHNDVPAGTRYDAAVHRLADVLVIGEGGLCLLKRTGHATFEDVTQASGLGGLTARRAAWADYEHDGDLDLLLARSTGLELWQNNGDATFVNVTSSTGLPDSGSACDVLAADLDADIAIDIITARCTDPTLVLENQRAGRFAPMPTPPGPWPAATRIVADDLNNDRHVDVILTGDQETVILLGQTAKRQRITHADVIGAAIVLVDYDNDGWLDLCAFGAARGDPNRGVLRLQRNVQSGDWPDVSEATGLIQIKTPRVVDVIPADFDRDGDTDLLLVTAGAGLRFLRNEGAHANGQLKIRLVPLKTNPSGLGSEVELRAGAFRVTRRVDRAGIELGLGGHKRADSVRTLWTNGVVEHQVNVDLTASPLTIKEKNVAAGSCPFLYAWDGSRFRFVTDVLGNSPIGLSLARGILLPADPDEIIFVGSSESLPPSSGQYVLEITEEFREVLYLDDVRLIAVDHPSDVEVHPTDKLMAPPFPPSEVWALGSPRRLIRAVGDDGIDRTEAVRSIDGVFAPPGIPLPPPYRGMCHPLTLTIDFDSIDASAPLALALTGWLQYGDASTNIAMSQDSGLTIIPPTLEVETQPGRWNPVDVVVGMPCGKTKTILCDLTGKLPAGSRRLRLTTTFEIRWDRIALLDRRAAAGLQVHERSPIRAELSWRGFSELKSRAPHHPTTPDYEVVFDRPPWRTTPQGWCTRYGDVIELVTRRDDQFAIVNAGDAVTLAFDVDAFPPQPRGMQRSFFLFLAGWEKDADHNVVDGHTVEPLPTSDPPRQPSITDPESDWQVRYNTRWVPRNRFAPAR